MRLSNRAIFIGGRAGALRHLAPRRAAQREGNAWRRVNLFRPLPRGRGQRSAMSLPSSHA